MLCIACSKYTTYSKPHVILNRIVTHGTAMNSDVAIDAIIKMYSNTFGVMSETITSQCKTITLLEAENAHLKELLQHQLQQRFGKSAECDRQESIPDEERKDNKVHVASHTRKKKRKGKLASLDNLPSFQQIYDLKEFYGGIKTVLTVHSVDEYSNFSRDVFAKAGVTLPDNIKGNKVNCYEAAAPFADLIIAIDTPSNNVTKKLMKLPGVKAHKKKLVSILLNDDESPDFIATANALNEELTKHFV